MAQPKDNSKNDDEKQALINMRRAYTTGGKLGARQMFIFNEDGTIKGLKQVEPSDVTKPSQTPNSKRMSADLGSEKDKKFGKLSSQMSVSAMSVAESKVAFSDANYMP